MRGVLADFPTHLRRERQLKGSALPRQRRPQGSQAVRSCSSPWSISYFESLQGGDLRVLP